MNKNPIFILGRFRSGTSHFWHIFNQLPDFKAWYEPLHPQLLLQIKYTQPKADHVNINDYWSAYRQLNQLSDFHKVQLGSQRLYLRPQDEWLELRQYLEFLMAASGDKRAVLQFNRMDFRMSWLTNNYPSAQILYLKRNPLQLWYSQRKHIPELHHNNESYADAYELMQWCADLAPLLPFLAPRPGRHAFYRFYLIYRLSVIMGMQYADVVIDLDEDVFNSDDYLQKLKTFGLNNESLQTIHALKYIPERYDISEQELDELSAIMTDVDALLQESGLLTNFGAQSLNEIQQNHPEFWQQQPLDVNAVIAELTQSWHQEQAEKIKLLAELDDAHMQIDEKNVQDKQLADRVIKTDE